MPTQTITAWLENTRPWRKWATTQPKNAETTMARPPIVGVPCLARWCSGPRSSLPRIGWPLPRLRKNVIRYRVPNSETIIAHAPPIMTAIIGAPAAGLAGDGAVVEVEHLVADGLGAFVTLAGDQHDVAGSRRTKGDLYGLPAIWFDHNAATVVGGDPLQSGIDDRQRVLGAWVVGGDDDVIGQPRGHGTHQRPLLAIAITAAAEHHVHGRIAGHRTCRADGLLQPVGRVGVVDDHGERLTGHHGFEPARHCRRRAQPARDRRRGDAEPMAGRGRGQAVHHVERAADRHLDRPPSPR